MNNLIGAADYSIVRRKAIRSTVFYNDGIWWWSGRLDDLSSWTITQEHSQEQTWQAWPWAHNLVSLKPVVSQTATLQQPHLPWEVDQKLGHKSVGCIYAPYKVNPNIFQSYFDFLDIFHHTSMHTLFRNIYGFYLVFYDFISCSIIYNNYLYSRWHFLFWFCLVPDLLILSHVLCPELKSRLCMRS